MAGVDAGARFVKLVLVRDGAVLDRREAACGIELAPVAEKLLAEGLAAARAGRDELAAVVATGAGAEAVPFATARVTVVKAAARAAVHAVPGARTVIDIGAEECRGVRCDGKGNVTDFALNDKCAAGAGSFIEAMSRALEVPAGELGGLAAGAARSATMSAQCVIFAESEVVSMIHRGIAREEIARSVYDSMASRVAALLGKTGVAPQVAVLGGVAKDHGFLAALGRTLGTGLAVPEGPEFSGALGAALSAREAR